MSTTHYYFDHISWNSTAKQWVVHLQIPMNLVFTDSLIVDSRSVRQDLCLLLESAKHQDPKDFRGSEYQVITRRHQIDRHGRLFVTKAQNIRQQPCTSNGMKPASHINTPLDSITTETRKLLKQKGQTMLAEATKRFEEGIIPEREYKIIAAGSINLDKGLGLE